MCAWTKDKLLLAGSDYLLDTLLFNNPSKLPHLDQHFLTSPHSLFQSVLTSSQSCWEPSDVPVAKMAPPASSASLAGCTIVLAGSHTVCPDLSHHSVGETDILFTCRWIVNVCVR
jgi:hypothetical protein